MTGKKMYEVGDKVKIISKKIIGTIKVVNIEKFTNYESLKEDYRCCYLINDGKNYYYVGQDDVELYSPESQLAKYKKAFNILENCGLQINENGDLEIDNADFKVVFEDSERLWEIDVELFKELIGNDR